ncbi:MAG TPA: HNH endonuclease signature motif containing protein, partial [Anaeromyxobacteraceae bacterium]|nr:HNH endonuclease signature motif containing protein [Anaeromyxobacteraceae bacterium]
LPGRVAETLDAAFRAVRAAEGRLLPDGSCLVRVARHFLETWTPYVKRLRTRSRTVKERDRGRCQVPGCSRLGTHVHHVTYRSWGGGDDDENLISICACHHLRGIHGGFLRVRGTAPDGLVWEVDGEPFTAGAGPSRPEPAGERDEARAA